MRYRAFISYSHTDDRIARRLHRALEAVSIPKHLQTHKGATRLRPIFIDREELSAGADLSAEIQAALQESAWLIVMCSPASARSQYVQQEIMEFKKSGRAHRILCVLVSGEPYAADAGEECIPAALRFELDESGGIGTKPAPVPLAADLRPEKDGFRNTVLKLASALMEVSFDSLKQRELQRTIRNFSIFASIGFVALLAIAVGLILAVLNGRLAQQRLNVAAETARASSERVLDLQQEQGLRTGVAKTLISDVERDLYAMLNDAADANVLQFFGLDSNAKLLESLSHTLLNFSEIELQENTSGAQTRKRFDTVRKALTGALNGQLSEQALSLLEGRLEYLALADKIAYTFSRGTPIETLIGDLQPLEKLATELRNRTDLKSQFLSAQITALKGQVYYNVLDVMLNDLPDAKRKELRDRAQQSLELALSQFDEVVKKGDNRARVFREVFGTIYALSRVRAFGKSIGGQDLGGCIATLSEGEQRLDRLPVKTQRTFALRYESVRMLLQLGNCLHLASQTEQALTRVERAEVILKELIALDPDNDVLRQDLLMIRCSYLSLFVDQQNPKAIRVREELQSQGDPNDLCPKLK